MKITAAVALLFVGACFNPTYNNPTCSPEGECPSGLTCVAGTCRATSDPIDAMTSDGTADAPNETDAPDASTVDAEQVDIVHLTDDSVGTVDFTVSGRLIIDTTNLTADSALPPGVLLVSEAQTNGTAIAVLRVSRFVVGSGSTLIATGNRPLAIVAGGSVTIDGTIDLRASGLTPGAGGFPADQGPGRGLPAGTGGFSEHPGGGGAGHGTPGARGGQQVTAGGPGGPSYGDSTSDIAGGSGGGHVTANGCSPLPGGSGGGGLLIYSAVGITMTGVINANGGGGITMPCGSSGIGGAGGGSGGRIDLQAPTLSLGTLVANGGGGAGASSSGSPAEPGFDGLQSSQPAPGGMGIGSDGGRGGDGGAGTRLPVMGESRRNSGGGGGAHGRIYVWYRQPPTVTLSSPAIITATY